MHTHQASPNSIRFCMFHLSNVDHGIFFADESTTDDKRERETTNY